MRHLVTLSLLFASLSYAANSDVEQQLETLDAFQTFCLDTNMDAENFSNLVGQFHLEVVQREFVTEYMNGIIPFHIYAYRLHEEAYLIWEVQGEITSQQRQLHRAGNQTTSSPINADNVLPDVLGLGTNPIIGAKGCRILSFNAEIPAFSDLQSLSFENRIAGEPTLTRQVVRNFPNSSESGDHLAWRVGGEININYFQAYTEALIILSVSQSVSPDDAAPSYLIPE